MQHYMQQPTSSRSSIASLTPLIKRLAAAALLSLSFGAAMADEVAEVQRLMSSGRATEALQRADQYLAGKPRDPMMRFLRGLSLSQLGRNAEAITTFTKITEDYPELPEPFNNLAVLYAQQGQYDKARTALEMAIRTNPSYATAYENLGDVYAKLASQAYSKALQIDTRSAVAPKLAMIRDLFPKEKNSITAVAAATTPPPAPAPAPAPAATPAQKPETKPEAKPAPAAPPVAVATAPAPKPPATATPTPAPKPEAKPETRPAAGDSPSDVEGAVQAWATAWSRKDVDAYLSAYARDFDGGKSRKVWEQERRARIAGKRSISVKLSGLQIRVNGDKATASFHQDYKADSLSVSSAKTLELVKSAGGWVIVKESTGS